MTDRKRLPWRCKTPKQAKDKADIYNSKEWRDLRIAKLQANPLCEKCIEDGERAGVRGGYIRSAEVVHHIHPIEDSSTMDEMRRWAFMWSNLQSLCRQCHAAIHNQKGYHTKAKVTERREQGFERWKARMKSMTNGDHDPDPPSTEDPGASI